MSTAVSRRQLLKLGAGAAAAWIASPWRPALALVGHRAPSASASPGGLGEPGTTTLEAFADTLIPGQKRFPGDHAVAGAVSGPGAVQAGAIDLMKFPPAGIYEALPAYTALLDAEASGYAVQHGVLIDPALPPLVALPFADRTDLLLQLLEPARADFLAWYALSAFPFLAFHTAGQLPTAYAVRHGHPGLVTIGFPAPDADGLWRFPLYSYRRRLASPHPATTAGGNPP